MVAKITKNASVKMFEADTNFEQAFSTFGCTLRYFLRVSGIYALLRQFYSKVIITLLAWIK
jgi:hypothetical protein